MKLTKKKADELCWEKWNWHYHNPSKTWSSSWPRWEQNGGDIPYLKSFCPYCEFHNYNTYCGKCPINLSGHTCDSGFDKNDYWYKCRMAKTPYFRKKYAKLIRDIAGRRLGK